MRLARVTLKDPILHPALKAGHFLREFSEPEWLITTDGKLTDITHLASGRVQYGPFEITACELHETEKMKIRKPPACTREELRDIRDASDISWGRICAERSTRYGQRLDGPAPVAPPVVTARSHDRRLVCVVFKDLVLDPSRKDVFRKTFTDPEFTITVDTEQGITSIRHKPSNRTVYTSDEIISCTRYPTEQGPVSDVPSWWYPLPGRVWVQGRSHISLLWETARAGIKTARALTGKDTAGYELFILAPCEGFGDNVAIALPTEQLEELRKTHVQAKLEAWGDVEARETLRVFVP